MKIIRVLAAAFLLLAAVTGAAAQETMRLYVEEGAAEPEQAQRLLSLLAQDMEDVQWVLDCAGTPLRELVLAGKVPDLAICRPAAARTWAQEGLLLPLQMHIPDQGRIQRQVLDLCVYGEALYMAPLIACHRQMAVNRGALEQMGLEDMLDQTAYPVWYPAQFRQILEEFMIRDRTAVDIWHANAQDGAAIEALVQALYGGMLLGGDGRTCHAGDEAVLAGVQWLADAAGDGLIGVQKTREETLARFLEGETAIFIDWTPELGRQMEETLRQDGAEIVTMPYPSALRLPVRSFELTGVCAFGTGDESRDARLMHACAVIYAAARDILGPAGIWQDGAIWLSGTDGSGAGATLHSLVCAAIDEAIETGEAAAPLLGVQAAMDALGCAR